MNFEWHWAQQSEAGARSAERRNAGAVRYSSIGGASLWSVCCSRRTAERLTHVSAEARKQAQQTHWRCLLLLRSLAETMPVGALRFVSSTQRLGLPVDHYGSSSFALSDCISLTKRRAKRSLLATHTNALTYKRKYEIKLFDLNIMKRSEF